MSMSESVSAMGILVAAEAASKHREAWFRFFQITPEEYPELLVIIRGALARFTASDPSMPTFAATPNREIRIQNLAATIADLEEKVGPLPESKEWSIDWVWDAEKGWEYELREFVGEGSPRWPTLEAAQEQLSRFLNHMVTVGGKKGFGSVNVIMSTDNASRFIHTKFEEKDIHAAHEKSLRDEESSRSEEPEP